jgi:hypothetical protein
MATTDWSPARALAAILALAGLGLLGGCGQSATSSSSQPTSSGAWVDQPVSFQDPTGSAADYGKPLPFSAQLEQALRSFVDRYL